jgi:AcrR family transcriptional regulator
MPKQKTSFREIRYNEKRQKILENAAKLFARKGYEKATLEEIAAKLKLTKGSLYHYIKSKEEMLFQIQMQALDQANEALERVLRSGLDPVEKLREAIKSHVQIVTREHVIGTLRQQELLLPRKWREKVVAERDRFERAFQSIILEGVEAGVFERKNWRITALAALGALNWIPRWYSPRGELSAEEIGEAMADFILRGFAGGVSSLTT